VALYIARADFHRRLSALELGKYSSLLNLTELNWANIVRTDVEQALEFGVDLPDVSNVLQEGITAIGKGVKSR
jgi:hypothetical protein